MPQDTPTLHQPPPGPRGLLARPLRGAPHPPGGADGAALGGVWDALRALVRASFPDLPVPPAVGGGLCASCRGPARPGRARCFQCGLHAEAAPGLLADEVAPVAYAPKGGALARDLWLYKSGRPEAPRAAAALLALLLVFLHDRGAQLWRRAGLMAPTHVAVVPSGRGRPGPHPLAALTAGHVALPLVRLTARPGGHPWARCLDPDRFVVGQPVHGTRVLLLDDTWVSGGTAQSAAVALKRAGSRSVVMVALGRHLAADGLPAWAARWTPGAHRLGP